MPVDRRKLCVFGGAITLRILLFTLFPTLPDLLTGRVEVSTPVSSFKRLQEGVFLYTRKVSPYDGGVYHQAPILLPIFSLLPQSASHPLLAGLVYVLLDLLNAAALITISDSGESVVSRLYTSTRKHIRWDGVSIAAGYLFNPFVIATCLGRSTNSFTNSAILYAISNAVTGNTFNSVLALGFASYLSLYPALLYPPLILLCYDRNISRVKSTGGSFGYALRYFLLFVTIVVALLYMSYILTGNSWEFISATYGVQLLVPDLTPNAGLWWYFLIEIFDPFREFFLGVFWLHLASYVGAFTVRMRTQPLFVITSFLGVCSIFKPYPSISDVSIYFALLPLYRHVFPLMRYTFFAVAVLLYATLLGPIFHHLWIYAGSGNANFFYAITLVWSLGLSILVADSIFAVLRDEWEKSRPDMKGKYAKQI
ncbi:phosphatidylinositol glycan anchor biosynthesis class U protein [Histoplasma capsulatum G186AR]|uniref:Phosphatidylinositol glycan anchor biosynthesis class U protein n=2 Tax=Ajellomyces capsulatus TaxID=5037 RepID=C0NUL8_AJECG|nr:phosphatidylinositol glycan anchor biosynthesis class U protein [Histoplasma capsulatum G186AR]EEH05098.1 phosphatidylinositol glycan anchor biosynthesis class U protein [Histoplasma capsulatum G186AR]KAG5287754.1 phosphatidylinositol glycan anchor biosynthesis class U protein [Histoplasma capsulatum]QSS70432.1 phosphatidylinositol glycan anchor biosynthesis class U protein [Histoplasma capsulatum G186AR]